MVQFDPEVAAQTIAFWVGLAVALSIIGGIVYGIAYSQQQDRLEKILRGESSSECDANPYLSSC